MENESYYKSIGFMCGLEIHQRLATNEKLFCSCMLPSLQKEKENNIISRYQRAVAGELGAIDVSAQFEEMRNRMFTYKVFDNKTCLVDIDEEPPHNLNREALDAALSFACALNTKIINELQPMRKEVVDGSNPSIAKATELLPAPLSPIKPSLSCSSK